MAGYDVDGDSEEIKIDVSVIRNQYCIPRYQYIPRSTVFRVVPIE